MSINPATDLNLEELFQPAWAKGSDSKNPYAKYEPRERPERREHSRGGGPNRPREDARGERRRYDRADRGGGSGPGFRNKDRSHRHERREALPPPPEINVGIHAEDQGAESLARQIKTTGRAYPLFDIARMILQKPERYTVAFTSKKGEDGQPLQPIFVCALDDTVWMSADEAITHVLQRHLATFYETERTATEPPKGTYTFVAQCGLSGTILGPPNHHDYQSKLRDLHARRFSRMPFETYKSRVKIVRDEAVVKQWVEEQSWKTEYLCLNVPESARLPDMAAVEQHFREVHQPVIIRQVTTHTIPGPACQKLRGGLYRVYRDQLDQQRRFPMQIASSLSQQFASRGLQFFKVNKTVTHVWVARPTYLDLENSPVSDGVRRIVQFVEAHPRCTRRQVMDALAPTPERKEPPQPAESGGATESASGGAAIPPAEPEPTPEQTAIIGDLHWLVHQGHVIEFANGTLETAKKPVTKPPAPTPKKEKVKTVEAPKAGASETANTPEPVASPAPPTPQADAGDLQPSPEGSAPDTAAKPPAPDPTPEPPAPV